MSESKAHYTKTTVFSREQVAKARQNGTALTKPTHMAFGNGATQRDSQGKPVVPTGNETALKNELLRKPIDGSQFIGPATIRYTCTLTESDLVGRSINEIGLFDSNGKLLVIRHDGTKEKLGDEQLVYIIDDIY